MTDFKKQHTSSKLQTTAPESNGQRRSHKKTRNGCLSCKSRHIKCDEAKPSCGKCVKGRYTCQYGKPRASKTVPLAPKGRPLIVAINSQKPHNHVDQLAIIPSAGPLFALFENSTDYQYFQFFRSHTTRNLTGFSVDNLWDRIVLQACQEFEFARLAVVAIAALHKTTESHSHLLSSTEPLDHEGSDHHRYALVRYAKALRLMKNNVSDLNNEITDEYALRKALIASLLMTCFESFHGNQSAALAQTAVAVKLLYSVREKISRKNAPISPSDVGNSVIDKDLLSVYARLELDAILITRKEIVSQDNSFKGLEDEAVLAAIPSTFQNLQEARWYWDILVRRSTSWRTSYGFEIYEPDPVEPEPEPFPQLEPPSFSKDTPSPPNLFSSPNEAQKPNLSALIGTNVPPERYQRLADQLLAYWVVIQQFSAAFAPLYAKCRLLPTDSPEFRSATSLEIGLQATRLMRSGIEAVGDNVSGEMLLRIKETLGWQTNSSGDSRDGLDKDKDKANIFTFDSCIVHHLFIIATRSCDRVVRKEAITMLKRSKRRERLRDSEICGRVAEWFYDLDLAEDQDDGGQTGLAKIFQEEGKWDGFDRGAGGWGPGDEEKFKGEEWRRARLIMVDEEFDIGGRRAWVRCKRIGAERGGLLPLLVLKW